MPVAWDAEELLRGVLADEGIEAGVDLVAVNTDEEARSDVNAWPYV